MGNEPVRELNAERQRERDSAAGYQRTERSAPGVPLARAEGNQNTNKFKTTSVRESESRVRDNYANLPTYRYERRYR